MSNTITIEHVTVTCFECKTEFTWAHQMNEDDYPYNKFDPERDLVACKPCAAKLGDHSMHYCLRCGSQFQTFSIWEMGCSEECSHWIDAAAERAQDRDLEREQAWLESYGEEEEG